MKIEVEIDEDVIAKAVAKKLGNAAPAKPAKSKPAKAAAEEDETDTGEADTGEEDFGGDDDGAPEVSKNDVLEALKAVSKKHDQDTAMEVLRKVGGVNALSKLDEDKYADVLAALKKKMK